MHKIVSDLMVLAKPIEIFTPDKRNAREHDETSYQTIAESLSDCGQRKPIVVRKDGDKYYVTAGNGTLEAAKRLGWTQIAAVIIEEPKETAQAYALIDNHCSDLSSFNNVELSKQISELIDFGMDIEKYFDVSDIELNDSKKDDKKEKKAPPPCPECGYQP